MKYTSFCTGFNQTLSEYFVGKGSWNKNCFEATKLRWKDVCSYVLLRGWRKYCEGSFIYILYWRRETSNMRCFIFCRYVRKVKLDWFLFCSSRIIFSAHNLNVGTVGLKKKKKGTALLIFIQIIVEKWSLYQSTWIIVYFNLTL